MFYCRKELPEVDPKGHEANALDRQMKSYRTSQLTLINKEAKRMRTASADVTEVIHKAENYLALLRQMTVEPQNSMPDVIIWMLNDDRRVAYYRCPAHHVLWSSDVAYRGKYCGKPTNIVLKVIFAFTLIRFCHIIFNLGIF